LMIALFLGDSFVAICPKIDHIELSV
jgi:hypothetical protein